MNNIAAFCRSVARAKTQSHSSMCFALDLLLLQILMSLAGKVRESNSCY